MTSVFIRFLPVVWTGSQHRAGLFDPLGYYAPAFLHRHEPSYSLAVDHLAQSSRSTQTSMSVLSPIDCS